MLSAPALSSDFARTTLASETDEVLVCLLEITHPSLEEPIRVSSDMQELFGYDEESGDPIYCTRHKGHAYLAYPFSFVPPGSPDDSTIPKAKLVISNVDRRIIRSIREIHESLCLKAVLVYASDPDTIISEIPLLWLDSVDYDAAQISAELGFKHFFDEPAPARKFTPKGFPGLWK